METELLLVYAGLAALAAGLARARGRNPFLWLGVGLIVSPVVAAVLLLVLPKRASAQ